MQNFMRKRISVLILTGSLFLTILFTLALATDVFLTTRFQVGKKWNILITRFHPMSGSEDSKDMNTISEVLKNDLEYSGYFSVITTDKVPTITGSATDFDLGFLKDLNVDSFIQGRYSAAGDSLYMEADVLNAQNGILMWGKRYRGDLVLHREMAHRFSDEVVYRLTGFKGIAESKIAFISKITGSKELYIMDYDGYNIEQLTKDNSITLSPTWSPDTNEIAYVTFKRNNPSIYIVNVNTHKSRLLAAYPGLNSAPAWSPDGKWIAATLNKDGNEQIYLLDPLGKTEPKRLTFGKGIDTSPCWSPTGRQIAFVSNRAGTPQIYIMDSDGSNVRRLTYKGDYNASPTWSPQGDLIAYVSQHPEGFNLYLVQVDGQNPTQLTSSAGSNEDPSWSPDGRHLVFSSTRSGYPEIYTLTLDGNQITQLTNSKKATSQPSWSR